MLLQAAVHISLFFTTSVVAVLSPKPGFDDSHLPGIRLAREEAEAMKESQSYPPGYIHDYVAFGEGSNAITVPVVEGDPAILLDNEDGIRARAIVPPQQCLTFNSKTACLIIYCWRDNNNTIHSPWLAITPGKNTKKSNPTSVKSFDINSLSLNAEYNTGYNNWFPLGHECSNSDTMTYTNHYLADTSQGVAYIHGLQCNNCLFTGIGCMPNTGFSSSNNLHAWSSNSPVQRSC